ncbi:MAG: PQQ-dependent sugar dehydrogenase [Planctomycetota bacterium]
MRKAIATRLTAGLLLAASTATAMAGGTPLTTERVASGLARPLYVTHAPGDFDRAFIVEQRSGTTGRIRILNLNTGTVNATPFLSVPSVSTSSEQGLLGLAFHPDYQNNGEFFIYYTTNSGGNAAIVQKHTVSANPDIANATGDTILRMPQPFTNHNGGWMGFGPNDGYLYIGTGDGGSACDPGERSQDITNQLLGKMLRIDVDGDDFPTDSLRDYSIPADNPFVGVTGDDEIWAYGLRNPWRCAFDRETGDLYMADVGQNAREEVNVQLASSTGGENYGWDCEEGLVCASVSFQCNSFDNGCGCGAAGLVDPVFQYTHGQGCSITGGNVYRGCAIPDLAGTYFLGDHCSNTIWSFEGVNAANVQIRTAELDPPSFAIGSISGFGEDAYGEMYICDLFGGEVFKIVADNAAGFAGPDCNMNGIADACEVLDGTEADVDGNEIPDVCEEPVITCPWDCTPDNGDGTFGNGVVNIDDLLEVINTFGNSGSPCDSAPDNGDGTFGNDTVNIDDLLAVINNFGACP